MRAPFLANFYTTFSQKGVDGTNTPPSGITIEGERATLQGPSVAFQWGAHKQPPPESGQAVSTTPVPNPASADETIISKLICPGSPVAPFSTAFSPSTPGGSYCCEQMQARNEFELPSLQKCPFNTFSLCVHTGGKAQSCRS